MDDGEMLTYIRQGRRRLRDLLPAVRASAAKRDADFLLENQSVIAEAMLPHITEERMEALVIYPAPLGGWHADLYFNNMPPGLPNALGTPVQSPCPTREDAELHGRGYLELSLVVARRNREKAAAPVAPVFQMYEWTVNLQPEFYEKARALMPEGINGYGSRERAITRIKETLAEFCPDGFNGDSVNTMPAQARAALLTVLHIAALNGVFAWPPRLDAAPSYHEGASEARH